MQRLQLKINVWQNKNAEQSVLDERQDNAPRLRALTGCFARANGLTLGMPSANALVLGDARWRLARPICANLKQFSAPYHFFWLDGFAVPAPAQVSHSLRSGTMSQAVRRTKPKTSVHFSSKQLCSSRIQKG